MTGSRGNGLQLYIHCLYIPDFVIHLFDFSFLARNKRARDFSSAIFFSLFCSPCILWAACAPSTTSRSLKRQKEKERMENHHQARDKGLAPLMHTHIYKRIVVGEKNVCTCNLIKWELIYLVYALHGSLELRWVTCWYSFDDKSIKYTSTLSRRFHNNYTYYCRRYKQALFCCSLRTLVICIVGFSLSLRI